MLNKVLLQGRFTADPQVEDKGGFDMCEFTIAWSDKYKEKETQCFLRCKSWREQAKFISQYFRKGQECVVEGRLVTESWEKEGQKQSRIICNVERINFCGPKGSTNNNGNPNPPDNGDEFMKIPEGDEELPFA
jgi:single-strand DNA-binding protein